MEKINNIFLNYKTYSAFQNDLNADRISPSSIAFIQDNRRIWAHGKEYACNSLSVQDNGRGSISFVDSLGNTVLALSADPNGYINISGVTDNAYNVFVSRGDFANYVEVVERLKRDFEKYKSSFEANEFIKRSELLDEVSSVSEYPVKSKAIYQALQDKLDNTFALGVQELLNTKQDTLIPGAGIVIKDNIISTVATPQDPTGPSNMVTLTKDQYDHLVEIGDVKADTYYFTYEGTVPSGDTWHFGDAFPIILTDNWAFGGTFSITLR